MEPTLKSKIAEELDVSPDELLSDTVMRDLEFWDSVMALTVMVIIETETGSPVNPDDFSKIVTFGDIEALVAKSN